MRKKENILLKSIHILLWLRIYMNIYIILYQRVGRLSM